MCKLCPFVWHIPPLPGSQTIWSSTICGFATNYKADLTCVLIHKIDNLMGSLLRLNDVKSMETCENVIKIFKFLYKPQLHIGEIGCGSFKKYISVLYSLLLLQEEYSIFLAVLRLPPV